MHRGAPVTQINKPQYVGTIRVHPAHETVMAKKKRRRQSSALRAGLLVDSQPRHGQTQAGRKQVESLDIAQYCDLMEELKSRVESINQLMEMPGVTIRTRVESICLQLRMLLELMVFSSLVSNKDV